METRTYTEKSNARRAARAAGVDPSLVFETEDGFAFPPPNGNSIDVENVMKAAHADAEEPSPLKTAIDLAIDHGISPKGFAAIAESVAEELDSTNQTVDDAIPAFCQVSPEERKAAWARTPPKVEVIKQETATMATKTSKRTKAEKPNGVEKDATLHKMLAGKGSTVEAMTKALGWLPHTLRARISQLGKAKGKGGEGLKIERVRVDGVTSYRIV